MSRLKSFILLVPGQWHIWLPLLLIVVLTLPHVMFLLPAHTDLSDECYQPLRTLKFFKSKGTEFHKYAPFPNFILAGPYVAMVGYWKLTGGFTAASSDFPYGFTRPMQQLGAMVLVSRGLFVGIGLVMFGILAHAIYRLVQCRLATLLAMLLFVVGNHLLIWKLPVPEVDSPMLSFVAGAMAAYVMILTQGLGKRRIVALTLFGVAAVSSKEVAGPLVAAMFLGAAGHTFVRARGDGASMALWRQYWVAAAILGVVSYVAINIVLAPAVWWRRMQYWVAGEGVDPSVWGGDSGWNLLRGIGEAILNNLGPGGAVALAVLIVAGIILRPRFWFLLMLPTYALLLLVIRVKYTPDRFYTPGLIALTPVAAACIAALIRQPTVRPWAIGILSLCAAANVWFSTITWEHLLRNEYYAAEQHALAEVDRTTSVTVLLPYKSNKGGTRLERLGFNADVRAVQDWIKKPETMPRIVYIAKRRYDFILDARKLKGREKMMSEQTGFVAADFPGLEPLGYRVHRVSRPVTWLKPFWFMPAVRDLPQRDLLIFGRP